MGLARGHGGGGLQAPSGEGKFNKRQSMATPARSRALLGREGSPGACHLWLRLWPSDPPRTPGGGGDNPAGASWRGRGGPNQHLQEQRRLQGTGKNEVQQGGSEVLTAGKPALPGSLTWTCSQTCSHRITSPKDFCRLLVSQNLSVLPFLN